MKSKIVPAARPGIQLQVMPRAAVMAELGVAVAEIEGRFRLQFESVTVFSEHTLAALHAADDSGRLLDAVQILSKRDAAVLDCLNVLTAIANRKAVNDSDRRNYLDALLEIYARLGCRRPALVDDSQATIIGIEREGRILAERLDLLAGEHSIRPHAKRVHFKHGLAVGLCGIGALKPCGEVIVVDGAIASGATLIALIEHLRGVVHRFRVYSAHATEEGLRALVRYATTVNVKLELNVGHSTAGLNEHHYAVVAGRRGRLVVGDLGDMISPIAD